MLIFLGLAATEGTYCYWWPALSPEAIVMSGPVLLLRALSGSLVLLQLGVLLVVCAVTRNHMEAHGLCPCCKNKKATFDVISMTADAQSRGRNMEGFCDNPTPHSPK